MKSELLGSILVASVLLAGCGGDRSPTGTSDPPLAVEVDALGNKVSIHHYPRRIVSTAPSNTEILLALGLRGRLVGVTSFYRQPERVKDVVRIGGYTNPSASKIISLDPDIVFAARGNSKDVLRQLRRHGLTVFTLDTRTVADLLEDIEKVGGLAGVGERAERVVRGMDSQISAVRARVSSLPEERKPRVFWVAQEEPLRTAGSGSLVDELIKAAGGTNVARDEARPWPSFSMEKLVLCDPQVIVLSEDRYRDSPDRVDETVSRFQRHAIWGRTSAVQEQRVKYIPADYLGQPSPAVVTGLRMLAKTLHPDLFPEALAETPETHEGERK